jgi:hypothetical protein
MFSSRKRFSMESLEARQMMAGDLAAYAIGGNLYITEANGQAGTDNGVRVSQLANGMIRVEGAEANDGTDDKSLVNGQTFQDFMIPGDLIVKLGAGHDRLHLGFDGGVGAPSFNNISINMAAAPLLVLSDYTAMKLGPSIFNTPDDDQVFGWGFSSRGSVNVTTGAGSDWVFMGRSFIGDGAGVDKLTINTGAGADSVTMKGTHVLGGVYITTYNNAAENDSDSVWFDSVFDSNFTAIPTYIQGNTEIYTGGGGDYFFTGDPLDDYFFGLGLHTLGSIHVSMGDGDDLVDVAAAKLGDANHWSNLSIYTGAGADDITVDFSSSLIEIGQPSPEMTGGLFISAGSIYENDVDVVRIPVAQVGSGNGSTNIYLGGGNDVFELTAGNWGYNLLVDAGGGNDTGFLAGFLYNKATVRMGEGDDNLTLGHVNAYQLNLEGGSGVDRLRKEQVLAVDYLFENSWEYINGFPQWMNDIVWKPANGGVFAPLN